MPMYYSWTVRQSSKWNKQQQSKKEEKAEKNKKKGCNYFLNFKGQQNVDETTKKSTKKTIAGPFYRYK